MRYPFVVAGLNGVEENEIGGTVGKDGGKQFALPLASMATAGFTVRDDHDLADFLLQGDALLKVYQEDARIPGGGRRLAAALRLITASEDVSDDNGSVATAWADPYWVLMRRLIGKSPLGYSKGSVVAMVDPSEIASDVLAQANAEEPSGVAIGNLSATAPTYVNGWAYKPAGWAIAQLASAALGPTWRIRPQEPQAGVYGLLDFGNIGTFPQEAAFEYGDGLLNVRGYKRAVSLEGMANRVFHLPSGFPTQASGEVLTDQDAAAIAARELLEAVVEQDLAVDDLRRKLLGFHLAVRKAAKQTITFDPVRDVSKALPIFGVDFDLGDVVPFRAWRHGRLRIDATVRVYQASFQVTAAGSATPSLTVTR